MNIRKQLFGAKKERIKILNIILIVTLSISLLYLMGVDSRSPFIITDVLFILLSLLISTYSGYIGAGVVSSFTSILVSILWIQIVPPTAALILGKEGVSWYGTPWPLPVEFTPYEELLLGVQYGSVMAVVAGAVFGPTSYFFGCLINKIVDRYESYQ